MQESRKDKKEKIDLKKNPSKDKEKSVIEIWWKVTWFGVGEIRWEKEMLCEVWTALEFGIRELICLENSSKWILADLFLRIWRGTLWIRKVKFPFCWFDKKSGYPSLLASCLRQPSPRAHFFFLASFTTSFKFLPWDFKREGYFVCFVLF